MVLSTSGFTGTGTSAVTDYFKQFKEVSTIDQIEFEITHGVDGLEDLDYHLNQNVCKYMSSVIAIERFEAHIYNYVINRTSDKETRKRLIKLTSDYLESITQAKWTGLGGADYQTLSINGFKSKWHTFPYRVIKKLSSYIPYDIRLKHYPYHEMRFSAYLNDFESITKKFVKEMLEVLGADFSKLVVLDQAINGNNPLASMKFFDEIKVVIVDRDPRDIYVYYKYIDPSMGYQIPTNSVENFVLYYRNMRQKVNTFLSRDDIMLIHLEDMIYNYDDTVKKLQLFAGIPEAEPERLIFDPSISIANTQLFNRYSCDQEEIDYIEQQLSEYLFDYSKYSDVIIEGKPFANQSPLNK